MGDISLRDNQYFLVQLNEGRLQVQLAPNLTLVSPERIDDDRWHDITINLDGGKISAFIDGGINPTELEFERKIKITSEFTYIGGLPDIITKVLDSSGHVEHETSKLFDNNFQGLIQDIRINKKFLLFESADDQILKSDLHFTPPGDWKILYPKETSNIAAGQSNRNKSCDKTPCQNNGKCVSDLDQFKCEVNFYRHFKKPFL